MFEGLSGMKIGHQPNACKKGRCTLISVEQESRFESAKWYLGA
jgi:hypothetical protein